MQYTLLYYVVIFAALLPSASLIDCKIKTMYHKNLQVYTSSHTSFNPFTSPVVTC